MRSVFRTIGGNAGIDEKILEQQIGHFDKYHYDRSHEDLPRRAKALLPLWDYFRHDPAVAANTDVKTLQDEVSQLRLAVQMLQDAGKYTVRILDDATMTEDQEKVTELIGSARRKSLIVTSPGTAKMLMMMKKSSSI